MEYCGLHSFPKRRDKQTFGSFTLKSKCFVPVANLDRLSVWEERRLKCYTYYGSDASSREDVPIVRFGS